MCEGIGHHKHHHHHHHHHSGDMGPEGGDDDPLSQLAKLLGGSGDTSNDPLSQLGNLLSGAGDIMSVLGSLLQLLTQGGGGCPFGGGGSLFSNMPFDTNLQNGYMPFGGNMAYTL